VDCRSSTREAKNLQVLNIPHIINPGYEQMSKWIRYIRVSLIVVFVVGVERDERVVFAN
jgi:hypothetical protein